MTAANPTADAADQAPAKAAPAAAQPPAPAAYPPLQGTALLLGTLSLSLATFMNVLDSSIANVSIPAIAGDLGVSPGQGTWVITSFGVANAISLPLASYPKALAGTALALWGVTTLVAPVVGPLLGGWITDNISWPWIFYINVPVGLLAGLLTWGIYRQRETPIRKLPIDTVGLSLLVLWVGALQLMLDKGKELDWFASGEIITMAVVAVVAFAVFLVWELTEKHPVVDLKLFKGRNFTFGALALSVAYALFFGNVVLLPLWLQQWMGYTATSAGMALAPVGIFAILL